MLKNDKNEKQNMVKSVRKRQNYQQKIWYQIHVLRVSLFSKNRDQAVRNGAAANLELGLPPLRVRLSATAMLPWLMLGPLHSRLQTKRETPTKCPKNGIFIQLNDNIIEISPKKVEK